MRRFMITGTFALMTSMGSYAYAQGQVTIQNDSKDFVGVKNSISATVNLYQASTYKVEITTSQKVADKLEISVENGLLSIREKDQSWNHWSCSNNTDDEVVVNVWSPKYSTLEINGSGDMLAKTPIKTNEIEVKVNGSGDVKINELEAEKVSLKTNGSGDIAVSGKKEASTLVIKINGSGDIDTRNLVTRVADVAITGSGDVSANVLEKFTSNSVGSGDIYLSGNPQVDAKILGSGEIVRK